MGVPARKRSQMRWACLRPRAGGALSVSKKKVTLGLLSFSNRRFALLKTG